MCLDFIICNTKLRMVPIFGEFRWAMNDDLSSRRRHALVILSSITLHRNVSQIYRSPPWCAQHQAKPPSVAWSSAMVSLAVTCYPRPTETAGNAKATQITWKHRASHITLFIKLSVDSLTVAFRIKSWVNYMWIAAKALMMRSSSPPHFLIHQTGCLSLLWFAKHINHCDEPLPQTLFPVWIVPPN